LKRVNLIRNAGDDVFRLKIGVTLMYFLKSITDDILFIQLAFNKHSETKKLVICSFLASLAALFQAAGGFLPGIGYFISPLATAPILFCSIISIPHGFIAYLLTNCLLLILQPSELIVFPLTTGLLGLGIGAAFTYLKKRLSIIISSTILLTGGVIILLNGFKFPVLGPSVSNSFSFSTTVYIFLFAFLYCLIWVELSIVFLKRIKTILSS
jgi:hypothetical protein